MCDLHSGGDGIVRVQGPAGASCSHWKLPDALFSCRGYSPQPPTQEERAIFGGQLLVLGLPSPDGLLASFSSGKSHRKCLTSGSASVGRHG